MFEVLSLLLALLLAVCFAETNGRCAKNGGQCTCKKTTKGASCKQLNYPDYIKCWEKKNKNKKCDKDGNEVDDGGKVIYESGGRRLKGAVEYGNGGGCEVRKDSRSSLVMGRPSTSGGTAELLSGCFKQLVTCWHCATRVQCLLLIGPFVLLCQSPAAVC